MRTAPTSHASDDGRVADDRQRLRTTFDSAADLYHLARPDYPESLYDTLVQAAGLRVGDRLLEIGCATGKATIPLARRGFRITCIEGGAALTAAARSNLAEFPHVEIIESAFETWSPPAGVQFDLVFAATAWHWLDPATRYQRAWKLLRAGGHLAFWSATHVFPENGDPFFFEIQDIYDEIGEALPPDATWWRPDELPDDRDEIESSGLFEMVLVRHFDWQPSYDADEYLRLLDTFSGHIAMEAWQRDRLYAEIRRRLRQRSDGRLQRHWGAVLHVAVRG
jgi:SAM-dependent methyltransferase